MNRGEFIEKGLPEDIFKMDEELIRLGLDIPFTY